MKGGASLAALAALLCLGAAVPVAAPDALTGEAAADATMRFAAAGFTVTLDRAAQTLIALVPGGVDGFDFAPSDRLAARRGDGYHHLGDIALRLRRVGEGEWRDYSTASRRLPVRALPAAGAVRAAADLTPALPAGLPLRIERRWLVADGHLALRFTLSNPGDRAIEIGGLGLPMVFNNILTDRSLAEAHGRASFADPSIARDAGYLQVTRLNGAGPALVVVPEKGTPFEAYKPIEDGTKRGQTFEGFYAWMVASRAFAEREWKGAEPWNAPTALVLKPGERREIGVRFLLAPGIRAIEPVLAAAGRPVAVGIPGYVVPTDLPADLFLKAAQPVSAITVHPEGALEVTRAAAVNGWARYRVRGRAWGRARLTIRYADGSDQTIAYFVTKPSEQAVADLGRFLTTRQWYDDPADPFRRGPSIMSYDREADAIVLQDQRVWIAGLSDEGGAGAWLAAIMKQLGAAEPGEVAKFERFVTGTLDGRLQVNEGPLRDGVRKSLFFYDSKVAPGRYDPAIDWSTWASWDRKQADSVVRSFNYVHVAAAHWVLYRLGRYREGLVKAHDWRWYLDRAYRTALAMPRLAPQYARFGQMEGDVFIDIIDDLRREGMMAQAGALEAAMRVRADAWAKEDYPFGSEMPWDSTGQPEVYAWMRRLGETAKAELTREVILGYDPLIPSWGYNGNARRYWDFLYAGKDKRIERQIHHYGSANNAIPLFDAYRRDPADIHLLRVAYGGLMGTLTNIDQDGFGSAAFHSDPDHMRFDAYSGDYGTGFFGLAYATAAYLVDHPAFGWIGFGGLVEQGRATVGIVPRDAFRNRLFIAPAGLWLTLDAGRFSRVDYAPASGQVTVRLDPAEPSTPTAYLRVETTVAGKAAYRPASDTVKLRGAYVVPLTADGATITLSAGR
ncbi:DUF5695 domain-containing protein [Sphingomonas flavalba]|uniref:DUF5695 domain-containing protein n=1 Tax=Sphingomonas flavalba TaxID=2559804 RepID=UPI00109D8760|nr:DUF5695 domain-containing protein [Sphingomonas flavalba]